MKTELKNRDLFFTGESVVTGETLSKFLTEGKSIEGFFVDKLTPDIEQYNRVTPKQKQIRQVGESSRTLDHSWTIPEQYMTLDVDQYIYDRLDHELIKCGLSIDVPSNDLNIRLARVVEELKLYKQLDLINVLRALIYIINTLSAKGIVWGVGRGSSVSSYVLYLIGVHDVDSIQYDLDIRDFLRVRN